MLPHGRWGYLLRANRRGPRLCPGALGAHPPSYRVQTPVQPPCGRVRPRLLTGLCYGAMMSLAIGVNLLPVFLTSLSRTFGGPAGLSQEQLGRLGALNFSGLVVGILAAGPLADRYGSKGFTLAGNGVIAASLIGMSVAPTYAAFCAAAFWLGLGAGTLDLVLSPIVAALNPHRRSAAMNWLHSFYCVGAVVTVLAGAAALRVGFDWRHACLALLPLPVALVGAFAPLPFPALVTGHGSRQSLRRLLQDGWFIVALIAIGLGGATELGMAQWLPAYAETSLGFSKWIGAVGLALFSLAMAVGRMAVGSLSARVDPFTLMAWCCAFSLCLFLLGSFFPAPGVALAACVATGLSGSALWPTMLAVAADRFPSGGASMFGALAAAGNAGGILMPWVVGWVGDLVNLHWGLAVSGLAPLLMLPLVLLLQRQGAGQGYVAPGAVARDRR